MCRDTLMAFSEQPDQRTNQIQRVVMSTRLPDALVEADPLVTIATSLRDAAASVVGTVPPSERDAAVVLPADLARRLSLVGGRVSHTLAEHLATRLTRIRPGVSLLPREATKHRATLLDVTRRDVLVALDFRRYESANVELARCVQEHSARVVVITDTLLSPAVRSASVVLPVEVERASPFDTSVAAMALLDVLVFATTRVLGSSALERVASSERLAEPYGVPG